MMLIITGKTEGKKKGMFICCCFSQRQTERERERERERDSKDCQWSGLIPCLAIGDGDHYSWFFFINSLVYMCPDCSVIQ